MKLLASIGGLLLPYEGLKVQLIALLLAAVLWPARLAYHGRLLSTALQAARFLFNPLRAVGKRTPVPTDLTTRIPFCPFVFAGPVLSALTLGGMP